MSRVPTELFHGDALGSVRLDLRGGFTTAPGARLFGGGALILEVPGEPHGPGSPLRNTGNELTQPCGRGYL